MFVNAKLHRSFSSYFLTLIPKARSPSDLGNSRLISLLKCLYTLVANVLAVRLASVMNSLIFPMQSAFLKGRQLVDGVAVVNEVMDFEKRRKRLMILSVGAS